jgi:hypothetical protein
MDNRLFANEILYCEGRVKPYLRGKLHAISTCAFPIIFWFYYTNNIKALVIGWCYLFINFFTYSISALYHLGTWNKHAEIFIQKIDHCMVALYVTSKYLPMTLLIVPYYIGIPHITTAFALCIWNNYHIWNSHSNSLRLALIAGLQFPLLYYYYNAMTQLEWICNWIAIVSQVIAGYIFMKELTPSCMNPSIATFHEIYHLLSFVTGTAMWILNYSIIQRT